MFCTFFGSFLSKAQETIVGEFFSSGYSSPVDIAHAGDDRLFVVERDGRIWVVDTLGDRLPNAFLDITDRSISGGEQGLLGLAFHPDYNSNGYFYVNYTNNSGDSRISRFSVSDTDPNLADPDSELIIIEIDQPFANHNAGDLEFSPVDGYLYFGMGDGGSGNDPLRSGQDRQSLLGKMIRIDVDNGEPYTIPEDNPFAEDDFTLDEIWALGLRNPWRFSFDKETGDMYIGDVGQNRWEEINFQPADSDGGENYGWRCYEGNQQIFGDPECPDESEVTFAAHAYLHSQANGCSVTGGFVYRGNDLPDFQGRYIYADFCSGQMWQLYRNEQDEWVNEELLQVPAFQLSTFGEDSRGEIYYALIGNGQIFKLVDFCVVNPLEAPEITVVDNILTVPDLYETYGWVNVATNDIFIDDAEFIAPETGDYYVFVTDENGCTARSAIVSVTVSSTSDLTLEGVRIWPTIVKSDLFIEVPDELRDKLGYSIFNGAGQEVMNGAQLPAGNRINLNLPSGIYILSLEENGMPRHVERFFVK